MVTHISGFILGLLAVFAATSFTLYRYGNVRQQHILVTLATLVAWYFSFIIVFILPLDISSTSYQQCLQDCNKTSLTNSQLISNASDSSADLSNTFPGCQCIEPWSNLPKDVLLVFWKVVYWSSQVLTWLVLPLMQSYSTAGEFTVLGKLKSAVIANLIYYGTYLVIFCICLIYVATKPDIHINAESLKVIGITASNTWGLFLLVLLYGYGLVDVPRSVWQASYAHLMLQQAYFRLAKLSMEYSEAQEKYEDTLEDVRRAAEAIKYNHPYRKYIDTIVAKCPEDFQRSLRRNDDYVDYNEDAQQIPTEKQLIKMHINVMNAKRNFTRTRAQRVSTIKTAIEYEDDISNQQSTNRYYKSSTEKYSGIFKLIYSPRIEWFWKCVLRAATWKAVSVALFIVTVMVVWSECVFFVSKPPLSLFALFIKQARSHFSYVSIEVISILAMTYLCVCAFRTVFKIRVFNYYYLATNHQSDEYSLLFSAMLLSRLTPPLCLNFLSLIHLDSHVTRAHDIVETAYTHIMGHMDVISFIANGFNIYFPIAIVLLCMATALRLGSRLLHCIGFEQFIDTDITQETVDEGRNLVRREKLKRERERTREERAANWQRTLDNSNLGNTSSASGQRNNYKSCLPSDSHASKESTSAASTSASTSASSSSHSKRFPRKPIKDDKTKILDDQDFVEYNPAINDDVDDFRQQQARRPKRSTNIFDDV